jgi:predicted RNA-binding protein (virulence factor B family)
MKTGELQTLVVSRISDVGLYLKDDEGVEVLLPNRFTRLDMKEGDEVRVFVYHDSEDRLVASTENPLIKVGEVAALKVVDKSIHGAFLDWGLFGKHLFLPNRNQQGSVIAGQKTVVYMYVDERTGRCVATNKIKPFIYNEEPLTVKVGDEVDVLVAFETPIGYRVVIDNRHWAMIYKNQLFRPIHVGDRCRGWVRKITEDLRIDVSLQQQGLAEVETSVVKLEQMLKDNGGKLNVNDKSEPQDVARITGMSKKVFKRALGMLLKQGKVRQTERGIEVIK